MFLSCVSCAYIWFDCVYVCECVYFNLKLGALIEDKGERINLGLKFVTWPFLFGSV